MKKIIYTFSFTIGVLAFLGIIKTILYITLLILSIT